MNMSSSELKVIGKIVLIAIARATNFSTKAHVAEPVIRRYYPKEVKEGGKLMKKIRSRAYGRLESKGLIRSHPTRGSMTWNLTPQGVIMARKLLDQK